MDEARSYQKTVLLTKEKVPSVIYVSKEQIQQVQYLIEQSLQGNHILFDLPTIRKAFHLDSIDLEQCYAVEHHVERLIAEPSFERKRAYLEALDSKTNAQIIRTYFNIVENAALDSNAKHPVH